MSSSEKKIILLRLPHSPEWNSCEKILNNIQAIYEEAYPGRLTVVDTTDLKIIRDLAPDVVIIADHRLNFEHTIGAIKSVLSKPIDWVIHAYGCFTGRISEFMNAYQRMGDDRFKIIAASKAHQQVIASLFTNINIVEHTPFPFRKVDAFFSEEVRKKTRDEFSLKNDETVLMYAGRISFQKNVHQLIKLINQYNESIQNKKIKLIICGEIDDLNPQTDEAGQKLGLAKELFEAELQKSNTHVMYLGQLNHDRLIKMYHAVDGFISLSTHFGEDYGFAVAEALGHGLPCFLSQWGGYRDFASLPQVQFVHPINSEREFIFEFEDFKRFDFFNFENRNDNIQQFLSLFSDEAVQTKYKNHLDLFHPRSRLTRLAYTLYNIDYGMTPYLQKKQLFESGLLGPFFEDPVKSST
ncbi:MAG: glycosyltransferase [Bacteriovoracaceae bacterium]